MHLTLWQQFSGNHSASYTIVGEFPTPDYAEAAYVKLRAILLMLADDKRGSQNKLSMTAAEIEIAEQYGIDWQQGLDWIERMRPDPDSKMPPHPVDDVVTLYDRLVFVSAPGSSFTWQTGHQFVALIHIMAGEAFQSVYMGTPPNLQVVEQEDFVFEDIYFTITCDAADEGMAGAIVQALNQHVMLDEKTPENEPMPWAIYHPQAAQITPHLSPTSYAEAEQRFFQEKRNGSHEIWLLRRDTYLIVGKCDFTGTHVALRDVQFTAADTGTAFHALCSWLRARGCRNLTYSLRQVSSKTND
jgi:hypothetical protein